MTPYSSLKEEAWKANKEIPLRKLALYTWGNVSAFDKDKGVFAIKPSGVPYDELKIEDMVVIDLDGRIVEGTKNPSSDTPTHLELYKCFKGIGGITHTHSTYATSWAQASKSIPLFGTTHADHCANTIVCTPFISKDAVERDYEKETGILIINTFLHPSLLGLQHEPLNPEENPMVLVAGHGPFTWGENAEKSVYNSAVLEEIAKMTFISLSLNPCLTPLQKNIVQKHYNRKHGKNAYSAQQKK